MNKTKIIAAGTIMALALPVMSWAAESNTPVSQCVRVSAERLQENVVSVRGQNHCGREIDRVYILISFHDADGARIGLARLSRAYLRDRERFKALMPAPEDTWFKFEKVSVLRVTENLLDLLNLDR